MSNLCFRHDGLIVLIMGVRMRKVQFLGVFEETKFIDGRVRIKMG